MMFMLKHAHFILNDQIYHFKQLVYIKKIIIKKKMSVELCVRNYETSNGLMNGANEIFENFTKTTLNR